MTRTTLLICISAIGIVAGGFGIWWYFADPPTSRYQPLIALLEQNKLPTDFPGHVNLSRIAPGVTPRDEMMFTRREDGSFLAMFPTKYGEGSSVVGLMYTSRPLRDEDTGHSSRLMTPSDRLITVGSYGNLNIDARINEHWYHVSYRMR